MIEALEGFVGAQWPSSGSDYFFSLTDGALGGGRDLGTHGRASGLGGHLASEAGSGDTEGSHCDGCGGELVVVWKLKV